MAAGAENFLNPMAQLRIEGARGVGAQEMSVAA